MAILLGIRFLPKLDRQTVPKLDLPGIIMAPIAFVMLAYGVHEGSKDWGSLATISSLIVEGLALIGFIVVELAFHCKKSCGKSTFTLL
jgi:hypothetical protein